MQSCVDEAPARSARRCVRFSKLIELGVLAVEQISMATDSGPQTEADAASAVKSNKNDKVERREIKGGLPYVIAPGVLKRTLDSIIPAERPDKFSGKFMETILKLSGGGARSVPPFLKKMQFIGPDTAPTILYSKFKTDSGRSQAAYDGIRSAFSELFKRNEYIHKADENAVKDVIVEITGLKRNDNIVRLIYGSFDAVRPYIIGEVSPGLESQKSESEAPNYFEEPRAKDRSDKSGALSLSYQINIVLPETENILVFNAIFKSLRENLLR